MIDRRLVVLVAAVSAAALLLACEPSPEPVEPADGVAVELTDCELPGIDWPARCGTYDVFEDRAAGSGRTIPLNIAVLPAASEAPAPDPLLFFVGGPGDSAVQAAGWLVHDWAPLLETRDLVLIDVRGTGQSNPLMCPYQEETHGIEMVLESFMPIDQLDACRELLEARADLTQYTTANIVDDLDEVVQALGYRQVNIAGASYGTRVVQSYLRRHGDSVRTAVIEGALPMDAFMPSTFARDTQAAFDGLVAECAEDPACHAAFPDPRGDLDALLAIVRESPKAVEVIDPESREPHRFQLSEAALLQTVRYMLYDVIGSLQLPAFLHAAATGNWQPIGQTAWTIAGGLMTGLPDGLYLSVVCPEDVVHIDQELAYEQAEGTLLGDFRLRQQVAACETWPSVDIPDSFHDPVISSVPTLIVSGERDPVTPAAWGDLVGAAFTDSVHMVVPDGAHSSFGLDGVECITGLIAQLVDTGSIAGLDTETCAESIERPPFLVDLSTQERVDLDPEHLARCVGRYGADGLVAEVTVGDGGTLTMTAGRNAEILYPISPSRFVGDGAPPGDYTELVLPDDGSPATALRIVRGGIPILDWPRQP